MIGLPFIDDNCYTKDYPIYVVLEVEEHLFP